ncbi:MAG: glutamate--tRNA ligase [Deltaproteobacteria bacterium]|nr:glutamate--tRNA ligase [Deltaproteobacteria bacterium]
MKIDKENIVTRFPPSPTGTLHIGGARTALFNWLFSRHHHGRFILRIEDTDTARSTKENTETIIESLRWLGLDWDEGPYFQSQRSHVYNAACEKLLSGGKAYYCHCSPKELEEKRKDAIKRGLKPKYDGTCRDKNLGKAPGAVVRLKSPLIGSTTFKDLVKGTISIENEELDDLILQRSDGTFTYNFAVVVDDSEMGVTYVIRGDDHINNTPRQILIYKALGEPIPHYAHLPMILGTDKTPLSKRHGATSVLAYKEMGILPHALLNSLARLGWAHGDQEKFSLQELIDLFSLDRVGKSAGIFNMEKLLDLNAKYIREETEETLTDLVIPFLHKLGCEELKREMVTGAVRTLKARSKTLLEMAQKSLFYFQKITYEPEADEKFLVPESSELLEELLSVLRAAEVFTRDELERILAAFIETHGIKLGVVAQPLRVALTGTAVSPGIFEVMEVMGRDMVLTRLTKAIAHIKAKGNR